MSPDAHVAHLSTNHTRNTVAVGLLHHQAPEVGSDAELSSEVKCL